MPTKIPQNNIITINFLPPANEGEKPSINYVPAGDSFQFPLAEADKRASTGQITFQIGDNVNNYIIAGIEFMSTHKPDQNHLACVSAFSLVPTGVNISFNFGNDGKISEGALKWKILDTNGMPVIFSNPDPQIGNDGEVNP